MRSNPHFVDPSLPPQPNQNQRQIFAQKIRHKLHLFYVFLPLQISFPPRTSTTNSSVRLQKIIQLLNTPIIVNDAPRRTVQQQHSGLVIPQQIVIAHRPEAILAPVNVQRPSAGRLLDIRIAIRGLLERRLEVALATVKRIEFGRRRSNQGTGELFGDVKLTVAQIQHQNVRRTRRLRAYYVGRNVLQYGIRVQASRP